MMEQNLEIFEERLCSAIIRPGLDVDAYKLTLQRGDSHVLNALRNVIRTEIANLRRNITDELTRCNVSIALRMMPSCRGFIQSGAQPHDYETRAYAQSVLDTQDITRMLCEYRMCKYKLGMIEYETEMRDRRAAAMVTPEYIVQSIHSAN